MKIYTCISVLSTYIMFPSCSDLHATQLLSFAFFNVEIIKNLMSAMPLQFVTASLLWSVFCLQTDDLTAKSINK